MRFSQRNRDLLNDTGKTIIGQKFEDKRQEQYMEFDTLCTQKAIEKKYKLDDRKKRVLQYVHICKQYHTVVTFSILRVRLMIHFDKQQSCARCRCCCCCRYSSLSLLFLFIFVIHSVLPLCAPLNAPILKLPQGNECSNFIHSTRCGILNHLVLVSHKVFCRFDLKIITQKLNRYTANE